MSATFWNGIIADHAASQLRATELVTPAEPITAERLYRGWEVTWDYGYFTATGPDYDASWEGEEDGWVDNGHRVTARTRADLEAEVDAWFAEQESVR